jgi:hypothetical protein
MQSVFIFRDLTFLALATAIWSLPTLRGTLPRPLWQVFGRFQDMLVARQM